MNLDQIKERYSEPHRFYHNYTHIDYIFKTAEKEGVIIEEGDCLWYAILYHDIIYDPTRKDNEGRSFHRFEYDLNSLYNLKQHFPENHIYWKRDIVKHMIYSTTDHRFDVFISEEYDYNCKTLIDLDLSILGDTWEVYQEYVANIRKEYAHATDEQWKEGRGKWLSDMIGRKSIYYTDWGKKREDQAMKNMMKELKDFGFIDFSLLLVK